MSVDPDERRERRIRSEVTQQEVTEPFHRIVPQDVLASIEQGFSRLENGEQVATGESDHPNL